MIRIKLLLIAFIILSISSCTYIPDKITRISDYKPKHPEENKALVYILAPNNISSGRTSIINLNNEEFYLPTGTYTYMNLNPGTYTYKASGFVGDLFMSTIEDTIDIEKGETLYLEVTDEVKLGHTIVGPGIWTKNHFSNFNVEIFNEHRTYIEFCELIDYKQANVSRIDNLEQKAHPADHTF